MYQGGSLSNIAVGDWVKPDEAFPNLDKESKLKVIKIVQGSRSGRDLIIAVTENGVRHTGTRNCFKK